MKIMSKVFLMAISVMLSSCSSVSVWPFGDDKPNATGFQPANSNAYVCDNNYKFFVRMLNNGNDAWLILSDREVSLAKSASDATQFSNGITTLVLNGENSSLEVNKTTKYAQCKPQVKASK